MPPLKGKSLSTFNFGGSMKRVLDVLVSSLALSIFCIPFVIVALLIKLSSKGPVFFKQIRIGLGGQPFAIYKFRTMTLNNEGPLVTAHGDSRITFIGRYLRRWKVDELPQFFNVIKGDMSLVGPRPETEGFVRYYTPEQRTILNQTPGLAGMAQLVFFHEAEMLRGHPNPEEAYIHHVMPKKLLVDLEYEKRRTVWSDVCLLMELALLILGKSFRLDRNIQIASSFNRTNAGQSKAGGGQRPLSTPPK